MKLFPRIDDSPAIRELAGSLSLAGSEACRSRRSTWHNGAWYGPDSGDQVGPDELGALADALTAVATSHGYPARLGRETKAVDIDFSILLYERMSISPVEAAAPGIWGFLACVVVPDIVAWRWAGKQMEGAEAGNLDRWVVGRRWYRHALGRLWWRACMFRDPDCADDPWHLMRQLQEDEFIQLQERPQLAAHQEAVRALIAQMLATFAKRQDLNRGSLMRAAAKRLLRLGAVVELDAIDRPGLHVLMAEMAERAVQTVERDHAGTKTN